MTVMDRALMILRVMAVAAFAMYAWIAIPRFAAGAF